MNIIIKTQAELDALPARFDEYTVIEIHAESRIIITKAWENTSVEAWENAPPWRGRTAPSWRGRTAPSRRGEQLRRGAGEQLRRGAGEQLRRGAGEQLRRGAGEQLRRGVGEQLRRGVGEQLRRGVGEQLRRGAGEQLRRGAGEQLRRGVGEQLVEARGNSSVVAWENTAVHVQSSTTAIELFGFAVAWLLAKATKIKKHGHAQVITPTRMKGTDGWLDDNAIVAVDDSVVLFKRVSREFKTQEGTDHETTWILGATLEHPAWSPEKDECGAGKFHACSRPYFCDEFRSKNGDRYIAVKIALKDLYAWPDGQYPHKIAFRVGTVLHEVDKLGRQISS